MEPNQYHSCCVTDKETHLNKMSTEIEALFQILLSYLQSSEAIEINYLKPCIQFKNAEIVDFNQQLKNWLLEAYYTIKKK